MITQDDRDAASAAILQAAIELDSDDVDNDDWLAEAFAAHRIAAEKAVLSMAWIIADSNGLVSLAELERKLEQQP